MLEISGNKSRSSTCSWFSLSPLSLFCKQEALLSESGLEPGTRGSLDSEFEQLICSRSRMVSWKL